MRTIARLLIFPLVILFETLERLLTWREKLWSLTDELLPRKLDTPEGEHDKR